MSNFSKEGDLTRISYSSVLVILVATVLLGLVLANNNGFEEDAPTQASAIGVEDLTEDLYRLVDEYGKQIAAGKDPDPTELLEVGSGLALAMRRGETDSVEVFSRLQVAADYVETWEKDLDDINSDRLLRIQIVLSEWSAGHQEAGYY